MRLEARNTGAIAATSSVKMPSLVELDLTQTGIPGRALRNLRTHVGPGLTLR